MTTVFSRIISHALASGIVATLALSPSAGVARDGEGFTELAGTWAGGGVVTANGKTERIRCRVSYAVSPDKFGLNQTLVCASDSYRFDVFSNVVDRSGQISGQWSERTRNVVGNVTGSVRGNQINTHVDGGGFAANLSIVTNGNRQHVVIRPQNYEVSEVSMSLTKSR